jgi:uncharacterized protein YbjT (DUF2867 family)
MRILVLGAYGFIGLAVARRLREAGHDVVGLGRDSELSRRLLPEIAWIAADLTDLASEEAWLPHLRGIDAVVNASGVLQDGAGDDVAAVQSDAIQALIRACERGSSRAFVQISAPGATPAAETAFMRTKGEADQALMRSGLDWFILKPGLVVGANAYGGGALLRMLAGLPYAQVLVSGTSKVQIVALDDVTEAVRACLGGEIPERSTFDLVADEMHTLRDVVTRFRRWLGVPTARIQIELPRPVGVALARVADLAGWFGWRSPLRSTALKVLAAGISGDARPWRQASGRGLAGLDEALARLPSTRQERIFARAQLVLPCLVLTLVLFWLLSGLIGLWQWQEAAAILSGSTTPGLAAALVILGSLADIAIGIAFLFRRWLTRAALAAIAVSLGYLVGGTILAPTLWGDPLGPFVKVLPSMALALAVLALAEKR